MKIYHNPENVSVQIGTPRMIAEGVGYCWFPNLMRFSTGECMVTYSLNRDSSENFSNAETVLISTDEGKTWGVKPFPYDVNGFHAAGGDVRISLSDGSIVGTSMFLRPDPPDQRRDFVAHYWSYEKGGRKYSVEPWGAHVHDLPRDVADHSKWSRTIWCRIYWYSDILELKDGNWLTTIGTHYDDDVLYTQEALVSEDKGRNWHYVSTVAGPDAVSGAEKGFGEPCLERLADGDIMCVSRMGSTKDQLLAKTYSSDEGRSWSKVELLPAYSVAPSITRLTNGLIAITTGRPGLFLWLSTDPRGNGNWESIDLIDHHNGLLDNSHHMKATQTTAYTANLELAPNRMLLVYDRVPFGWNVVPDDSEERSRIYLLEIVVSRD